jgi:cytochrome c-type biogenesis protein CcmF
MIPELGHFSLVLALLLALLLGVLPMAGAARRDTTLMALGRPLARAQFLCVILAFVCLGASFVNNDFSVLNVASNSNSRLPLPYRIAATWGSHEGSLLLWTVMLASWTLAVSVFSKELPDATRARVLAILGLISVGFISFLLWTSNPFERLIPAADEGSDLNPLLQDPGMVFHPPMLYMGYVGFSVAFAFALSALIGGQLDAAWARWSRPWTTIAWCFLTVGIALGSVWAYYELGWGGWWFWDPVENASFMPWLVGTALIHSLAVTEKRGAFKSWTVLLAIIAFSLSLVGTFLVRSGVLTSVHAFATDPARGQFILGFLIVVIGGSLSLYAWRAGNVGLGGAFAPVSREGTLLANNVLLVVAMASVLLGTLYPLFLDALNMGKISVGPPYFDAVFYPLMAPAVFLMGVGPIARWSKSMLPDLVSRLKWAVGITIVSALLIPLLMGRWSALVALGLALAFWVFLSTFVLVRNRLGGTPRREWLPKLRSQSSSWYGMLLAHVGVAVFIVGVTLVKGYETERDVRMDVGDTTTVAGYDFKFNGVTRVPGPNYIADRGTIEVTRNGAPVTTLNPEKRRYAASGQVMTEASIDWGLTRDLYASLGEPMTGDHGGDAWAVRIYYKPFVNWIWLGCLIMAIGGFCAVVDRRYRITYRSRQKAPAEPTPRPPAKKRTARPALAGGK